MRGIKQGDTDITLPESVTFIGGEAFLNCTSLKSINIPNGITNIAWATFSGCNSLETVVIPDSVTSIEHQVFSFCSSLKSIKIPDGVTSIGEYAFRACSSLTTVIIPNSVTSIEGFAFRDCYSLVDITMPDSMTNIGDTAFAGCRSLTTFEVPYGITQIRGLFSECYSLRSVILPDTVTEIGDHSFSYCRNLVKITIPDNVKSIGKYAFYDCYNLTDIDLPQNITSVGESAFLGCNKLMSITIPQSLISIGEAAFAGTPIYVIYNNSSLNLTFESWDYGGVAYNAKIIIDKKGGKNYKNADIDFQIIDTVDNFRFTYENGLYTLIAYLGDEKKITLPAHINGNSYRIDRLVGVEHVIVPEGLVSIGNHAFFESAMLKSVVLPDGLKYINYNAFSECKNLYSINFPKSLVNVSGRAFYGCTSLYSNINYYKNGVLIIDGWIVDVDENLEYIKNIEVATYVASDAYENCNSLKQAVWSYGVCLPSNVETLYITHINELTSVIPHHLTLKNIVILDTVSAGDLRYCQQIFQNLTDVMIYVEANEQDLRWDANFPGWSNGNKVVYGDDWSWTTFYDSDGNVVYSKPRLNSEVIVRPIIDNIYDGDFAYIFSGWDIDADGIVDDIPATAVVDIDAKAVMKKVPRKHTVKFEGANGVIYLTKELSYGDTITAPASPSRKGYTFAGWSSFATGMTADADYVFTAVWTHNGGGHKWSDAKVVKATCTEDGYTVKGCSVCDEEHRTDYTEAFGHSWGEMKISHAATCTEEESGVYKCSRCKETTDAVIPAKGHNFDVTVNKQPTCSKEGEIVYKCKDCKEKIVIREKSAEHNYVKKYASKRWFEWLIEHILNVFFGYEGNERYYFECTECRHIRTMREASYSSGTAAMSGCNHTHGD